MGLNCSGPTIGLLAVCDLVFTLSTKPPELNEAAAAATFAVDLEARA
jgi:hypothetical protein